MHPITALMLTEANEVERRRQAEQRRRRAGARSHQPEREATANHWTAILRLPRFGKAPSGA